MTESLLSFSSLLLFGQKVSDLVIADPQTGAALMDVDLATTEKISPTFPPTILLEIDGITPAANDLVLVKDQKAPKKNGVYKVKSGSAWDRDETIADGTILTAKDGVTNKSKRWLTTKNGDKYEFTRYRERREGKSGANKQLFDQLDSPDACFAKIYGFSFEGCYHDLARPALFLVHGDGQRLTEDSISPNANLARAPGEPPDTGLSVAHFQFSDDIRVWSYDKGDFSIRMDVTTGMLEDILLEAEIDVHMTAAAKMQTAGAAKMQISHAAKMQTGHRRER